MGRMQVAGKEVRSRAAARSIEVNHLGSSSMLRTSQIRVELTSSPSPTATTPNRRRGMIASLTVASQRLPSFHESRSIIGRRHSRLRESACTLVRADPRSVRSRLDEPKGTAIG